MENQVKKQLKMLLLQEDVKLYELARAMSEKIGKAYTSDSLSHRMARATITYQEMLVIAEILGYEIKFNKKEQ